MDSLVCTSSQGKLIMKLILVHSELTPSLMQIPQVIMPLCNWEWD